MDWYNNALYRVMKWYEGFNGPKSWPDAWAASIFLCLHALNVVAMVVLFGKLTGKSKGWFVDAVSTIPMCFTIVSVPYGIYFVRVLQRMKKLADPDEWPFRTKADSGLIWYVIGSIASFIGSIVYAAS